MRRVIMACLLVSMAGSASASEFWRELFTPSPGHHASPNGTPYAHTFFVEPAYFDRDLIIDYRFAKGVDGDTDEQELEFELEWALTERFGFVLGAPLVGVDPDGGPFESGFGDMGVGGRVLLVKRPRFLVSAFLELEIPTGDASRGLGHGEAAIAPFVLWWADLGNWTTFQGQVGPEVGLESGEAEMIYHLALTRSWQGPVLMPHACRCCRGHRLHSAHRHHSHGGRHDVHDHDDHSHHTPGLITAYLETTGISALSDADEGSRLEIVPGVGYGLTEAWDVRLAGRFPLYAPTRFDSQYILSLIRHF